jgi:TctA family transporter
MSNGSWTIFFQRAISGVLLAISAGLLLLSVLSFVLKRKDWRDKLAEVEAAESDPGRPS